MARSSLRQGLSGSQARTPVNCKNNTSLVDLLSVMDDLLQEMKREGVGSLNVGTESRSNSESG